MKKIVANNYLPKLNLKQTQEAIDFIEKEVYDFLENNFNLKKIKPPLIAKQNQLSHLSTTDNIRPINFDSSNNNNIYYVFNSYRYWLVNAITKLDIKNNNGLISKLNFINRDEKINNVSSMEKNILTIEYRFDNKDEILNKAESISKAIYKMIFDIDNKLKKIYKNLNNNFPPKPIIKENKTIFNENLKDLKINFSNQFGIYILKNIYDEKNHNSIYSNFLFSIESGSKHIDKSYSIFWIKDRIPPTDLESKSGESNSIMEEYLFGKDILIDKKVRTLNISIDLDLLSLFLLNKAHILEIQSGEYDDEIKKYLNSHGIKLL